PGAPATPMARQILEQPTLRDQLKTAPMAVKGGLAFAGLIFLAINAGIAYIVISGKLDGHWYDVRDLGNAVAALREWLDDVTPNTWASYWVTALIGGLGILSFVGGVL